MINQIVATTLERMRYMVGNSVAARQATEMQREVPTMASTLGLGRERSIDCDNLTRARTSPKECYA